MAKKRKASQVAPASSPEEALERFDGVYQEGDLEAAHQVAAEALKRFPGEAQIHHALGLTLWGLGKFQKAAEAIQQARDLDSSVPEMHLDLASILIDYLGDPPEALRVLRSPRRLFSEPEYRATAHSLRGRAWLALEEPRSAVKELRKARRYYPEEPELAVELAEMLIEALDFDGAGQAVQEALELSPEHPRPHWLRAFLLDRQGQTEEATGEFEEAARLAPDDYFVPERLGEEEFDQQVEVALAAIPRRFRRHLENAELAVEPYPSDGFLRDQSVSPFLLGLFLGTPMTERSFDTADFPPRILVFQRNLENVCRDRRELVREIGVTVRHEIGHLLGMDEDAIEDAGHA